MSPKDEIVKLLSDFFNMIGVDSLLATIFIALILSIFNISDIKNWKNLSSFQKTMDFAIWFSLIVGILALIIKSFRGD